MPPRLGQKAIARSAWDAPEIDGQVLLRDVPATNMAALDVVDAIALSPHRVEIRFGKTSFAQEADILTRPIVPQHVFSDFEDPSTEQIAEPLGSGDDHEQSNEEDPENAQGDALARLRRRRCLRLRPGSRVALSSLRTHEVGSITTAA